MVGSRGPRITYKPSSQRKEEWIQGNRDLFITDVDEDEGECDERVLRHVEYEDNDQEDLSPIDCTRVVVVDYTPHGTY